MDYDVLNWFFDADVQPAMINFENLHLGRRERSASRELLRTNGYWWIETSQYTFAIKEFLARPESGQAVRRLSARPAVAPYQN